MTSWDNPCFHLYYSKIKTFVDTKIFIKAIILLKVNAEEILSDFSPCAIFQIVVVFFFHFNLV